MLATIRGDAELWEIAENLHRAELTALGGACKGAEFFRTLQPSAEGAAREIASARRGFGSS